jgi:acid phosphatase (class A)
MKTLLLTCAIAAALSAQNSRKPNFITPDQLDVKSILPTPPANDSWQTRMDLAELHRLEETRTEADIAHAQADDKEEDIFIFRNVVGDKFVRENLPQTALLGDHLHADEGIIVNPAKNGFHRPRPYHLDTTLKPVCKTSTSMTDYAYPGGHATTGYLEAFAVARMIPEKRDQILARADDYAHSRLVCGAHYPTDLPQAKSTAYTMFGIMLQNPQFQKEFAAAKEEVRKALGL